MTTLTIDTLTQHDHAHDAHALHHANEADATDIFGFWMYIMTDCILFATLFASFAVMYANTAGHPALGTLFNTNYVLGETMFLLVSNLTFGLAALASYKDHKKLILIFLSLTFILGLGFVGMEVNEFINLIHEGHSFQQSGALSAFFTLVGTHGLHVSFGLLWILVMILQISISPTVNRNLKRRLTYLGLFWNFLDIVWIFVFTIVYLFMGTLV